MLHFVLVSNTIVLFEQKAKYISFGVLKHFVKCCWKNKENLVLPSSLLPLLTVVTANFSPLTEFDLDG